jgi:hypothetical protein
MENKDFEALIEKFTVPLFFRGNNSDIRDRNGTGVLVQLHDQYFIFTAGHCVDVWAMTKENDDLILPLDGKLISVRVVFSDFYYERGKKDFGFFKLSHETAAVIARFGRTFLLETQMDTSDPAMEETAVISGYPDFCCEGALIQHVVFRGAVFPTQDPRYPENFKVWVPIEQLKKVSKPDDPWIDANSQGISGGGCWVIRNIVGKEGSTPTVCLIGIHFLAEMKSSAGHEKFEAKVSNHIKLIEKYIDMHVNLHCKTCTLDSVIDII